MVFAVRQVKFCAISVNIVSVYCNSVPLISLSVVMTLKFGVSFNVMFASNPSLWRTCYFFLRCLRGWWPGRWILALGWYFTGISIFENLGVLILGTDTSKSCLARVNLIFWNFLGNFTRHQVVIACSNFHQCDKKVYKKCGLRLDFLFYVWFQRYHIEVIMPLGGIKAKIPIRE